MELGGCSFDTKSCLVKCYSADSLAVSYLRFPAGSLLDPLCLSSCVSEVSLAFLCFGEGAKLVQPSSSGAHNRSAGCSGFVRVWCIAAVLLIVLRPIDAPGFWWHLSRGREVAEGSLTPCANLLSFKPGEEADWAGGLPFYWLWTFGGPHAVASIALIAAALFLGVVWRRVSVLRQDWPFILLPLFFWLLREGLQPTPLLIDLLGLLAVGWFWGLNLSVRSRASGVLLIFVCWANMGPQIVWGLLWIFLSDPGGGPRPRQVRKTRTPSNEQPGATVSQFELRYWLLFIIAAFVGGALTPRALSTWADSVTFLFGKAFALDPVAGLLAQSQDIFSRRSISTFCMLFIWIILYLRDLRISSRLVGRTDRRISKLVLRFRKNVSWFLPLIAALWSIDHLPISMLWLLMLGLPKADFVVVRLPANCNAVKQVFSYCLLVILSVVFALDAAGRGPLSDQRIGWGIAAINDVRLLSLPMTGTQASPLIAWAADERSAGMLVWLDRHARVTDHPQQSLPGGRTQAHQQVMLDLELDRRAAYLRDDGSWGGWVRQLKDWNVDLLLAPVEFQRLNHSLSRSTWRSLDLDSPVLVYGAAEDQRISRFVLEALSQEGFVEQGPWRPTADIYSGQGWRLDLIEFLGGGPDPAPAIRQSTLFRAMDIPMASLRALLPVRSRIVQPSLEAEFLRCQHHMAYQEWMTFGAASEFRVRVVRFADPDSNERKKPWLLSATPEDAAEGEEWNESIERYLAGDLEGAIQALNPSDANKQFAIAMLWLELGESGKSLDDIQKSSMAEKFGSLGIAARYWQKQISQFER
jgi:hypothetical protein